MEPPVSEPSAKKHSLAATAAADPPEDPPGTWASFQGFFVAPKADVSVVEPMANSSMLVLPRITAPAFSKFNTASEENVGIKLPRIFEEQVVSIPSVHILSLIATGTPARGPVSSPASIFFCTSCAFRSAPSSSIVT